MRKDNINSIEEEVPEGPLNMLIREGTMGDCSICNSSTNWEGFRRPRSCIHPDCGNYEKNSARDREYALAKHLVDEHDRRRGFDRRES